MTLCRIDNDSTSMADDDLEHEPQAQSWWARLTGRGTSSRARRRSALGDDDEADTEPLLPARTGTRGKRPWTGWEQVAAYTVVLLLCFGAGWWTSRLFPRRTSDGKDDGPMVPPVWTLPPVRLEERLRKEAEAVAYISELQPSGLPRNPAYLIESHTGAVASEDETCSNLGLSILRDRNGTAVDAAVTTTLCIGLLNAFSSGIGGGGFMVIRIPEGPQREGLEEVYRAHGLVAIDFRETSPAKSEKEMYGIKRAGRMAAQVGGLAVGVPGELRGLEMGHSYSATLS